MTHRCESTAYPGEGGGSALVVGWDDVHLHRTQLRSVTDTKAWWERPYAALGWLPSRSVLAFGHTGPLVIPIEDKDGLRLAERLSSELIRLGQGAAGKQQMVRSASVHELEVPAEPSVLEVADTEGALVRSFAVRIGGSSGEAGTLEVTTTRVRIFLGESASRSAPGVLWQAPVRDFRQFIRFHVNGSAETVLVTTNPALVDARNSDKRRLGGLFDFTGRFPVVSCSLQDSQEISALCVGLMESGSPDLDVSSGEPSRPFCLMAGEELCQTYCLGEGNHVWLTTHRLIFNRPMTENITWECLLKDIEGVQQERSEGKVVDIPHLVAMSAIGAPLALSFPSIMSVIGLGLMAYEYIVLARRREVRAWVIPVTKTGWMERMSSEFGPRQGVTVGPPRPHAASARRTEEALWNMSIPVSGRDGQRLWEEFGRRLIENRERGGASGGAYSREGNGGDGGYDESGLPQEHKTLGKWEVHGATRGQVVHTTVSLTTDTLLICETLSGNRWETERIWRTGIAKDTRLSPIEVRSRFGGPLRKGNGCITAVILIFSVVASLLVLDGLIPSRDLRLGTYGEMAFVAGLMILLNRGLDSRVAAERASRVPALTVLPHPWSRPAPRETLPFSEINVSIGTGERGKLNSESGRIGSRWLDPIRPFQFNWGMRRPIPPIQSAPLFPAESQSAAAISEAANEVLESIRAGRIA